MGMANLATNSELLGVVHDYFIEQESDVESEFSDEEGREQERTASIDLSLLQPVAGPSTAAQAKSVSGE